MEQKKQRILWMDILNIFSCISVIILHTTNHPVHWWNGNTDLPYVWGMLTHTLFICAVPLFLMLSGANLLSRDTSFSHFFKRRTMRVGVPFVAWSLSYWLIMHRDVDIKAFWELFLQGRMNLHMWFFIPLFGIYFSIPFIRIICKHASRREIECYLLISLFLSSVMPFIFGTIGWFFPNYIFPMANQYLFIAILGYYLNFYDIVLSTRKILWVYLFLVLFHFGYLILKTQILGTSDELILRYESPSIIIMSACLFVLCKRIQWKVTNSRWIEMVASCSLGVYLIHNIFITYIPEYIPIMENPYWEFIVVYVLSLFSIMLIKAIPLLNKCV